MSDIQIDPVVADCTPTAKLVYLVLDECGPMTQQELRARTSLSSSTIRGACSRLSDNGIVTRSPGSDGRSDVWGVATENNSSA